MRNGKVKSEQDRSGKKQPNCQDNVHNMQCPEYYFKGPDQMILRI